MPSAIHTTPETSTRTSRTMTTTQAIHRRVRGREAEHRAEGVDGAEEVGLSGEDRHASDEREDEDRDMGGAKARVQAPQALGQLAVLAHRVREPGDANQTRVRGDEEDRRGQDPDVDLGGTPEPRGEVETADHAE